MPPHQRAWGQRPAIAALGTALAWLPARNQAIAAALGGCLQALAMSPWLAHLCASLPWVAASLSLGGWLMVLRRAPSPKQAGSAGWLYGCLWLLGSTGWVYVSLHQYGGMPAPVAAAAVLLLCAGLALYVGAAAAAWCGLRTQVWWRDALIWAGLWMLAELARAVIFTGFPWAASGYALLDGPFDRLAPWLGVYGCAGVWAAWVAASSFLSRAAVAAAPLASAAWQRWPAALVCVAAPSALLGLHGQFTQASGAALRVALIQSNVPQDEKFAAQNQGAMLAWHARVLTQTDADLIVAPETAIPMLPQDLPEGYWDRLQRAFRAPNQRAALVGIPLGSFETGYSNSVIGLQAGRGSPYRYDKHHLVPFGEFIPTGFHWFVKLMNMPLGEFAHGPLGQPPFVVKGQRIAPNVCYEDLFGEELASRFTDEAQSPTMMVNVSNLAWFGRSVAIDQHLQIARMRSLEFQLPTLRSTNTGATAVIDAEGKVVQVLPYSTRAILVAQVQGRRGRTPFARWASESGLWPVFGVALALVGMAWPRLFGSTGRTQA